jgi:hypothetical protein
MILVFTIVSLISWEIASRQFAVARNLETAYKLYALRDELREFAVQDPKAARHWLFAFLDSAIARSICSLPRLSIWNVLAIFWSQRKNSSFVSHHRQLAMELDKPKNSTYKKIHYRLLATLGENLMQRHLLFIFAGLLGFGIRQTYDRLKVRAMAFFVEYISNHSIAGRNGAMQAA